MKVVIGVVCSFFLAAVSSLDAQKDPGARTGQVLSGGPLRGLSTSERAMFQKGLDTFTEVDGVANGLGPRFNLDGCAGCHAQPAVGGSSPAINPQVAVAIKAGARNTVPAFIQSDGPIRVVRFRRGADGRPDGGVHDLFVITGRSDAPPACAIKQPDFSQTQNLGFRIPAPVFGAGLIESIPDSALIANLAANSARKQMLGIQGHFNTSGNDGTITRFGWKAQNKSLTIFSGEAYNVEVGVTNELFPQEREGDPACSVTVSPEDRSGVDGTTYSDVTMFSFFMRFSAPPIPSATNPSIDRGRATFDAIGCTMCHTPSLQSGKVASPALSGQTVHLYSDLALHNMGQALNDGITQGQADGQEWRTAPLWGLGDRIFLLHDGRTKDLQAAIRLHDSQGSEAQQVIVNFGALPPDQQQDVLNFLRSL